MNAAVPQPMDEAAGERACTRSVGVVLAHREGHGDLVAARARLLAQLDEHDQLVITSDVEAHDVDGRGVDGRGVEAHDAVTASEAARAIPARSLRVDRALVPELWAAGVRELRTERVALCSSAVLVADDWVATVRSSATDWAGAGGTIGGAMLRSPRDRAVHLTRFARHAPRGDGCPHEDRDLAADNAWYDRRALESVASSYAEGFWEPFVHEQLVARGGRLVRDPRLRAEMLPGVRFDLALRQRYDHGRRHGLQWSRGRTTGRIVAGILTAPLVPVAMTRRARHAATGGRRPGPRVTALAFVLFSAWAVGEAEGRMLACVRRSTTR